MPGKGDYDKIVIEEGGFVVELSNRGGKKKFNPNPVNYKKDSVRCRYEGCNETTRNLMALCSEHKKSKISHTKDWLGRVIPPGYGREQCLTDAPAHSVITEMLIKWMGDDKDRRTRMDHFISDILEEVVGKIPDATTLQENLDGNMKGIMIPDDLVRLAHGLVDTHFPFEEFKDIELQGPNYKGKRLADIPIRVVAALLVIAFICEESNRGDLWFCSRYRKPENSKYASAYMPSVYYFLRRYTKANEKQARMSLKG